MEVLFIAALVVAIAEIGDKTQLVTLMLSARFRRPLPIVLGVACASVVNHGLAAIGGLWLSRLLQDTLLQWLVGLGFLAMAVWALLPDRDGHADVAPAGDRGAFVTTFLLFFLMEMGDKTQIATAGLAAHHGTVVRVVAGSTLGMLAANLPAVWLGHRCADVIPFTLVRRVSAAIFAALGLWVLAGALGWIT